MFNRELQQPSEAQSFGIPPEPVSLGSIALQLAILSEKLDDIAKLLEKRTPTSVSHGRHTNSIRSQLEIFFKKNPTRIISLVEIRGMFPTKSKAAIWFALDELKKENIVKGFGNHSGAYQLITKKAAE